MFLKINAEENIEIPKDVTLAELMKLSERAFNEWDSEEDEIYNEM